MTARRPSSGILVRACARCGGDLYRDVLEDIRDQEEEFVCLQCGRRVTRSLTPSRISPPPHERRLVRRSMHSRILE